MMGANTFATLLFWLYKPASLTFEPAKRFHPVLPPGVAKLELLKFFS
jgi:hypothetical protein